jgi:hypothetical protein
VAPATLPCLLLLLPRLPSYRAFFVTTAAATTTAATTTSDAFFLSRPGDAVAVDEELLQLLQTLK